MIGGPTAVGKTGVAIELAHHLKCSIISADSRQVYHEMEIGTAKPSREELDKVNHYLVGHKSIHDEYSAGDYLRDAQQILDELFQTDSIVIAVGGTGLYIKALTQGLDKFPEVDEEIKKHYNKLHELQGIGVLQYELRQKDPVYASIV